MPSSPRRRVPGLRRSELAALAGISVEYLTRIEQGRDRNPSRSVLNAVSDAMNLDLGERRHLASLAKLSGGDSSGPCVSVGHTREVRPETAQIVDLLEPAVAVLTNRLGDLLSYTRSFELLARQLGLLDAVEPNITRFVFTDTRARSAFADWAQVADELAFGLWLGPSMDSVERFVAELTHLAGSEFSTRLERRRIPARANLRLRHPSEGELSWKRESLDLPASDAQQLVVYLPADSHTAQAFDRLRRSQSSAIHVVTSA
ncbi:transcriptional regulator with XRE-family HTH domain [Rhodococcus sp. 27YEA15]|uniref:helix-turn-helix domain-containing protein n=1 Tax=Rhodococcus sp. 27YEA15 TaxID=3156259 RepID=UPI003C7A1684